MQYWNQMATSLTTAVNRSSYGPFSYDPVRTILGSLLDNAVAARAPNATIQTYRKLNSTGYMFRGRSYGIGAGVGLAEVPENRYLQNFTFLEAG